MVEAVQVRAGQGVFHCHTTPQANSCRRSSYTHILSRKMNCDSYRPIPAVGLALSSHHTHSATKHKIVIGSSDRDGSELYKHFIESKFRRVRRSVVQTLRNIIMRMSSSCAENRRG